MLQIVKPHGDNEDNTMDNLEVWLAIFADFCFIKTYILQDTENGESTMEECSNISTQNKKVFKFKKLVSISKILIQQFSFYFLVPSTDYGKSMDEGTYCGFNK